MRRWPTRRHLRRCGRRGDTKRRRGGEVWRRGRDLPLWRRTARLRSGKRLQKALRCLEWGCPSGMQPVCTAAI
ncbi:hypothetical protein ACP70R_038565 [Stipagrostis hirtigluma subsp. patula]